MPNSVERYYQKKKKRKKRAKVAFFSLLFVLMMLTLVILSVTVFFNAETISVEGNSHYSVEQLLETGGLKIGQNLFRLDKFEAIEKMKTLPYVKDVVIKRKLPNTLNVTVVENQPVVWLATDTGAALMNEEYRVLELLELPQELLPSASGDPAEEPSEEPEEEPEEASKEDPSEEPETPVASPLNGIPQLTQLTATELLIGKTALFGEEDYTGFLARLYESFSKNPDLEWQLVQEVRFFARYDIKVLYDERITIDFGTLDRVDTKLELAAYLLKDNSTVRPATLDVTDPSRVYYRPDKT